MREIKFRAWDKESKDMLSDVSLWNDDFTNYLNEHIDYLKDKCELMQYTGLKDKTGKEIYEGDILKCFGDIARVVWDDNDALYRYVYNSGGEKYMEILGTHSYEHFEVIGNIYENPELLENK